MNMTRPMMTVAPTGDVVSIDTVAAHLSVDFNDDDSLLQSLIDGAVTYLDGHEGVLGRCLLTQQWEIRVSEWVGCFALPFSDVASAVVKYSDADDAEVTVNASEYELIERPVGAELVFGDVFSSPTLSTTKECPISITMTVGYGEVDAVPEPIKVAVMLMVAHWYGNPEAMGKGQEMPFGATALLAPYRRVVI